MHTVASFFFPFSFYQPLISTSVSPEHPRHSTSSSEPPTSLEDDSSLAGAYAGHLALNCDPLFSRTSPPCPPFPVYLQICCCFYLRRSWIYLIISPAVPLVQATTLPLLDHPRILLTGVSISTQSGWSDPGVHYPHPAANSVIIAVITTFPSFRAQPALTSASSLQFHSCRASVSGAWHAISCRRTTHQLLSRLKSSSPDLLLFSSRVISSEHSLAP